MYEHQAALQAGDESYSAKYFIISGVTVINVYIWNLKTLTFIWVCYAESFICINIIKDFHFFNLYFKIFLPSDEHRGTHDY